MPHPGERHGAACANLARILGDYSCQRRRRYVCSNEMGIIWDQDADAAHGPDVIIDETGRKIDQLNPKHGDEVPQLVAEVLARKYHWGKVLRRVAEFLQRGVAVVWVIDPENRTATVLLPNQLPQVLEENDELTGAPAFPDLRCRVADLFFMPEV